MEPSNERHAFSASFEASFVPMLIANDARRYIAANRAACLLLRLGHDEVVQRTIDDFTPPDRRGAVGELWAAFLRDGTQKGTFELLMPDGPRMEVDYSAIANIAPGRHLSILLLPMLEPDRRGEPPGRGRLTEREREVLVLIAMGQNGGAIAAALHVSRATVETHVRHCLAKLGAKNRAHAIALGLQRGEIDLNLNADEALG